MTDNKIIYGGDPETPVPNITFGQMIHDHLLNSKMDIEIMVDAISGDKITAKELLHQSTALAKALRDTGYGANAVFSIVSDKILQYFVPFCASLYNNTVVNLINPAYTSFELKHCLEIVKPKIIFCSSNCLNKILDLQKELKYIEKIILIDSSKTVGNATTLSDFVKNAIPSALIPFKFKPLVLNPVTTPAIILLSSGTTGLPKGVTLSHHNFVVTHHGPKMPYEKKKPVSTISVSPLYHTMGLNGALSSLFNNRRTILMDRFDEDLFLKCIQDYKIEAIGLPPPVIIRLASSSKLKKYDLSSLKFLSAGGAPLGGDVQKFVTKKLNLQSSTQGYGFTEITLAATFLPFGMEKYGSCGFLGPLMYCKVRDPETGKTLGPNETGELCFKGPQIMLGYYNNDEATKAMFTEDGFIRSGDIGYYDEEKYFYIVDRIKELIKYKGYQVAPAELESILLCHPKIEDAGVVGLPDKESGELPLAFVVKKPGTSVTEKEIQEYVADLVSPQKRLRGGVIFVPEIPKTASGKILRKDLRNILQNYVKKNLRSKL